MNATWGAIGILGVLIALLFCALVAVLRELVALRHQVARTSMSRIDPSALRARLTPVGSSVMGVSSPFVLAVSDDCQLCHDVMDEIRRAELTGHVTLLRREATGVDVLWDGQSLVNSSLWDSIAPVTPPALMAIDMRSGRVAEVELPVSADAAPSFVRARLATRSMVRGVNDG